MRLITQSEAECVKLAEEVVVALVVSAAKSFKNDSLFVCVNAANFPLPTLKSRCLLRSFNFQNVI